MRFSHLFTKTSKTAPTDAESTNAQLLLRGGFVAQEMAGVYTWLPLGLRVLRKVEQIVREEMDAIGGQEIFMPSLHPKEYWEATNRWEGVDILFKLHSQTGREYALGCSHEEVATPVAQRATQSYKDLPFAIYQINTKFRDELRAKSGVLRGREFRMKDMYSFHTSQEDLEAFYYRTLDAYVRVYERCGLRVKVVQASGGIFTENMSHEFQALTDAGEDVLIACTECSFGQNSEVATLAVSDACPKCHQGKLAQMKGVEVGNIFDLGTKYSKGFDFKITNEQGEQQYPLMGCYGIGTTRLVGAIVETFHDDRGICWPTSVAPFAVHLVRLGDDAAVVADAEALYNELRGAGVDVLYDDRDVSAGVKFSDAELLGVPVRLTVSKKTVEAGIVEQQNRATGVVTSPTRHEVCASLR